MRRCKGAQVMASERSATTRAATSASRTIDAVERLTRLSEGMTESLVLQREILLRLQGRRGQGRSRGVSVSVADHGHGRRGLGRGEGTRARGAQRCVTTEARRAAAVAKTTRKGGTPLQSTDATAPQTAQGASRRAIEHVDRQSA